MISRKGQGAMEYLMTYGWALLVIVVVGAALFALGVLNPATYTKSQCAGFGVLQYQGHHCQILVQALQTQLNVKIG